MMQDIVHTMHASVISP